MPSHASSVRDWLRIRKALLLAFIVLTAAIPLAFVDYNEPSLARLLTKAAAKVGSLAGVVLFTWQFVLGVRTISAKLLPDLLWGYRVHRFLGTWASVLLLLHPVFITVYYLLAMDRNPLAIDLSDRFSVFVLLGIVALGILAVIVLTSTVVRKRMETETWYRVHLFTWLFLPLAFVHSLPIGMTLQGSGLRYGWYVLIGVLAAAGAMRLLLLAGVTARRYRVAAVDEVGPEVTRVLLEPLAPPLTPQIGQFVYVRRGRWASARPYTVSHYDHDTGRLGVTIKALGSVSSFTGDVREGEVFLLDGPYGVFLLRAMRTHRPPVMLAGGIGITPFLQLIEHLDREGRQGWLFYGSLTEDEIVFRREVEASAHVRVVHVLSEQEDWEGEKGFITPDLLTRHLGEDLRAYEFLLCGPPEMIEKLLVGLRRSGVPREQIHLEEFGL